MAGRVRGAVSTLLHHFRRIVGTARLIPVVESIEARLGDFDRELAETRSALQALAGRVDVLCHIDQMTRCDHSAAQRRRYIGRPVKVVFLVHNPEAWYSLDSVYREMARAEDFEPLVASIPRRFPGNTDYVDEDFVHERLSAFGIPHLRFGSSDPYQDLAVLRMIDPHIIFRQSQWDADIPDAFHVEQLQWARLCLVPYEMANLPVNIAEPSGVDSAYDSYFHQRTWLVFCANRLILDSLRARVPNQQGRQFRVTGHPKADVLRAIEPLPATGRPFHVLWSGHHSVGDDWIRFGTFPTSAPEMILAARAHPQWIFTFSAHPALLTKMQVGEGAMTTDFVADFDRRWDELDNTNRFGGGGYADLFAGSDVLICDGLSWLIEFQFLNRPVIFLERADHVAFNPVGQRIVEGTYRVHSVAEAIELAEHFARGGEHRLAATQREIMAELFGEGGVAGRILDTIREQIAVENAQNAGYLVGADLSSRESVTMMIRAEDRR